MRKKVFIASGICLLAIVVVAGILAWGKFNKRAVETGDRQKPEASSPIKIENTSEDPADPQGTVQNALQQDSVWMEFTSVMDATCKASGIAAMPDGALLVTDVYNKVVWKVQPHNGISTVYAGGETVQDLYGEPVGGYNDSRQITSLFSAPWAIAPFLDGWAVSDADNNALRLISAGQVQTINGRTMEKLKVSKLGVIFDHPTGLAADKDGNLYVSDTYNGAVRKISPKGVVTTVLSGLKGPTGLCWKNGVLYIAETDANRIVKYAKGKCEVLAGSGEDGHGDGPVAEAVFAFPQGLVVGDDGTIYVADTGNSAVRMIKDGRVSTIFFRDRASLEMELVSPVGLLIQGKDLYICDSFAGKVLRVALPEE